jgi:hypothetical protein
MFTGSSVYDRRPDTEQCCFAVAWKGASWTDPDSIPLMVMQTMLGEGAGAGGVSSWLWRCQAGCRHNQVLAWQASRCAAGAEDSRPPPPPARWLGQEQHRGQARWQPADAEDRDRRCGARGRAGGRRRRARARVACRRWACRARRRRTAPPQSASRRPRPAQLLATQTRPHTLPPNHPTPPPPELADAYMAFNTNYHDSGLFGVYAVTDRCGRPVTPWAARLAPRSLARGASSTRPPPCPGRA